MFIDIWFTQGCLDMIQMVAFCVKRFTVCSWIKFYASFLKLVSLPRLAFSPKCVFNDCVLSKQLETFQFYTSDCWPPVMMRMIPRYLALSCSSHHPSPVGWCGNQKNPPKKQLYTFTPIKKCTFYEYATWKCLYIAQLFACKLLRGSFIFTCRLLCRKRRMQFFVSTCLLALIPLKEFAHADFVSCLEVVVAGVVVLALWLRG